jgi:hypothetical protein
MQDLHPSMHINLDIFGSSLVGGKKGPKKPAQPIAASKKKVEEEKKKRLEEEDEDEWDEDEEDDEDEDEDDDDDDEDDEEEDEEDEELSRPPSRSAGKPKRPNADWHYGSRKKRKGEAPLCGSG